MLQLMEENTEVLVGNNNRPSKAREKEEKSFSCSRANACGGQLGNIWSPSVVSHIMPIPEWNKQLYLDPRSLPSGADKGTRCYQREIGAEGRKIYVSSHPA